MERRSKYDKHRSFWHWVAARRATDTPNGDFVRDTRDILDMYNGDEKECEWRFHARANEVVQGIHNRLRAEYRRWLKRQEPR